MSYFKITVTYPNAQTEEIDQDFYKLENAIDYANHLLGQVQHNAGFHKRSLDFSGRVVDVEPYCLIKEFDKGECKIVFDTRNK